MLLSLRSKRVRPGALPAPACGETPKVGRMRYDPPRQPYAIRASYLAYFMVYYAASMGATWLLSAPRYLTCCFPLAIALASRARPRGVTLLLYAAFAAAQLAYLWAYVNGWPVY